MDISQEKETRKRLDLFSSFLMLLVGLISLLALIGWLIELPILASFHQDFIPMAPSTALVFLGVSLTWFFNSHFSARRGIRILAQLILAGFFIIVLILALRYVTGVGPDLENLLIPFPPVFGQVLTGRMAPLTALGFFLIIAAFILITLREPNRRIRNLVGLLSLSVFTLGSVNILGYIFGTPFFYGGTVIPVALTTALAFWFLSLGLMLATGSQSFPLRYFLGTELRPRLMRIFIPLTVSVVLLQGIFSNFTSEWISNHALREILAVLLVGFFVVIIISTAAKRLSKYVEQGEQAQKLQEAAYRIATAIDTTRSLNDLYAQIHQIISSVMPAENFYITLYDATSDLLEFPYFKDAEDEPFVGGIQPGKGLTAYVLRTGRSLLCTQAVHDELERRGDVKLLGVASAIWLGVPLIVDGTTIGAMVVQHYTAPNAYGEREQKMLEFVSTQVAIAINRKRAVEALHQSEAELRALFASMEDAVFVIDRAGVYRSIAPTNPQLLVHPPDELLFKTLFDFFPKDEAQNQLVVVNQVLDTKQTARIEYKLMIRGKPLWFGTSISKLTDDTTLWVAHDITQRKRFEHVQDAIFRITQAAITSGSMDVLYKSIHSILGELIPAENFYIALYDERRDVLTFPYFEDTQDEPFTGEIQPGRGLTAYVLRTGKSLLCTQQVHDELERKGEIKLLGVPSAIWLGVPLIVESKVIGVMVVQHYTDAKAYGLDEQNMLEFVSAQVAIVISRKQVEQTLQDREIQYRTLVEQLPAIVYTDDVTAGPGHTVYVSPQIKTILGIPPEDWMDGDLSIWLDHTLPGDRERILAEYMRCYQDGEPIKSEYGMLASDGRLVWILDQAQLLRDENGKPHSIHGVMYDVTERKQAEILQQAIYQISQAAEASHALDELYPSIHQIISLVIPAENFYIALYDPKTKLIEFPYYIDQYDDQPPEPMPLQGLTGYVIRTGRPFMATHDELERLVQQGELEVVGTIGEDWLGTPLKVEGHTIGVITVQSYNPDFHYNQGDLNLLEFVSTQVAQAIERKRYEEALRNLSLTDELTGLYNRRGFTILAEQQMKLTHRTKRRMLMFFGDVDKLKSINDTYGHPMGDQALKEFATVLKETFREVDIVARLAGDEFVILAPDASDESVETLVKRLQETMEARNLTKDRPYQLNVSVGVADYDPGNPCMMDELIARADKEMYRQKHSKLAGKK